MQSMDWSAVLRLRKGIENGIQNGFSVSYDPSLLPTFHFFNSSVLVFFFVSSPSLYSYITRRRVLIPVLTVGDNNLQINAEGKSQPV